MKDKIIEEMAKDMFDYSRTLVDIKTATEDMVFVKRYKETIKGYAKYFVEQGYRKIPENSVVLTREEYEELKKGVKTYNYTAMFKAQDAYRWEQGYLQGRKETAEKFSEKLKERKTRRLIPVGLDQPAKEVWFIKLTEEEIDEILKEITGE